MTPAEWQEAMRVASGAYWDRFFAKARISSALATERRRGRAMDDCPSADAHAHASARLVEARINLDAVKTQRPPYAPDWVDAMGRVPVLMMPEIEEAFEAEGET